MDKKMKKISMEMSVLMGVTLSFFLSLAGNLSSGHFTLIGFLSSFIVSLIISLIIGFLVPLKKITDSLVEKLHLEPYKLGKHLFEAFISDLIYTPVITLCMVTLAYMMTARHAPAGQVPPFGAMLGKSMILSMAVGYLLIFIFTPLYMKLVFKHNGITPSMGPGGRPDGAPMGGPENGQRNGAPMDPSDFPSQSELEDKM